MNHLVAVVANLFKMRNGFDRDLNTADFTQPIYAMVQPDRMEVAVLEFGSDCILFLLLTLLMSVMMRVQCSASNLAFKNRSKALQKWMIEYFGDVSSSSTDFLKEIYGIADQAIEEWIKHVIFEIIAGIDGKISEFHTPIL